MLEMQRALQHDWSAVTHGDPSGTVVELESRLEVVAHEVEEAEKARLRMELFGGAEPAIYVYGIAVAMV
jgi:hypothetical protein